MEWKKSDRVLFDLLQFSRALLFIKAKRGACWEAKCAESPHNVPFVHIVRIV